MNRNLFSNLQVILFCYICIFRYISDVSQDKDSITGCFACDSNVSTLVKFVASDNKPSGRGGHRGGRGGRGARGGRGGGKRGGRGGRGRERGGGGDDYVQSHPSKTANLNDFFKF